MGKYDHFISRVPRPERPDEIVDLSVLRKIAWMEESLIHGAPYFEIMWFMSPTGPRPEAHTHTFDEHLGFIGGDPEHPEELNATVKFMIEDEWYIFTKSSLLYIPAGIKHSPFIIEDVKKPLIHFSAGPNVSYNRAATG